MATKLSDDSIKRLAQRAGIVRLDNDVYDAMRSQIETYLLNILNVIIVNVDWGQNSTVLKRHVIPVLPTALYAEDIPTKKCQAKEVTHKKQKSKPLTQSLKEVRRLQTCSGLILSKKPFSDIVRRTTENLKTDVKYSEDAMLLIQYSTEYEMTKILRNAIVLCTHTDRMTVQEKDIRVAVNMTDILPRVHIPSSALPTVDFGMYIKKILATIHPDLKISTNANSQINYILNLLGRAISEIALDGAAIFKKANTVQARDVQSAVRCILREDGLRTHSIVEGTKAVTKYSSNMEKNGPLTEKAGLMFPPSRGKLFLQGAFDKGSTHPRMRIGGYAPIYLTAVLEYITCELVELSGNVTRNNHRIIMSSRDLMTAINNDQELSNLMRILKIDIISSGVMPFINSKFLPKKK